MASAYKITLITLVLYVCLPWTRFFPDFYRIYVAWNLQKNDLYHT